MLPDDAPQMWDRPFINAVARYETSLCPQAVLALAQAQERASGRKDRGKWGPRELDVDMLAYGDVALQSEALTLPHAGIAARDFVLLPWQDIAPDWPHPNIAQLAAQLTHITAQKR
jgi:2-amino-4-hydroxy-6-hydroxymethyldihydropteridine diphosphokinase